MTKRSPFRDWLYSRPLAETAARLGVTKTTIREWRTGRGAPHPLRHPEIIRRAKRDGVTLTTVDLVPRHRRNGK